MNHLFHKWVACSLVLSLAVSMGGCGKKKTEDKKEATAKPSIEVSSEQTAAPTSAHAQGKGNNKSDVPLVVGYSSFGQHYNPFEKSSVNDRDAIRMTQLSLLTFDREGAVVNEGIAGETRRYNGEDNTYYAPADFELVYHKESKEAVYIFKLRKDLTFSDGEAVTADDLIFTLYAYLDPAYRGHVALKKEKIEGLASYLSGKSIKSISGIEKVNDYEVKIRTKGYSQSMVHALDVPIVPLHVYGKAKQYNYDKGRYGFTKGNLSSLTKRENPVGGGAYKFIKEESGVIYYEANANYYLGCPKTAFVQLKAVGNLSEEQKTKAMQAGEIDIISMDGSNDAITNITTINSNGKLNGGTISTRLYDASTYVFLGMNADRVCVDDKPDSTRSKFMRTAFATLFSVNRYETVKNDDVSSKVINYPGADTSWAVPQGDDDEYTAAFVGDLDGEILYQNGMTLEEREAAACKAAIQYLKKAGYRFKAGQVVSLPDNSSKVFTVLVPKENENTTAMVNLAQSVSRLFTSIGFHLKVNRQYTAAQIEKMALKNDQQIWFQTEETSSDGDLYGMYHSKVKGEKEAGAENFFHIQDSDLDEYIEESLETVKLQRKIKLYNKAFEMIMDWAVEVPIYQDRTISIFSSSRIDMETVVPDITTYYSWMDEIQNVEMK